MKCLVTGGGGFLGGAIVRQLRERGHEVRSLARGAYPELEALGAEVVRGDIADSAAVSRAVRGRDVVFHVAAKAGIWGPAEEYERANVLGTRNVIAACREHSVSRLVFTSSPSVVYAGRDQEGVDESEPYPDRYLAHYPRTKAHAEQLVRQANGPDLATVSLRPHLIWGPRDQHLVPRILERGRRGQLRRVGRTPKLVDAVYIDNAAHAHRLAAERLAPGAAIAGKVYFIAQGEPVPMTDLIDRILAAGGLPPVSRTIPSGVAYAAGTILELIHALVRREDEPRMTRFLARQLSTAHWFDLTAARRDLGYEPIVSMDAGFDRLREWLQGRDVPPPTP